MLLADHLDRPAVRQRLVDGEIETGVGRLQGRAVERAAAVDRLRTAALRADVGRPVGALLYEQKLDATVGRSLQRLLPAGGGAAAPGGLLPPAGEEGLLPAGPPLVQQRPGRIE